MDTIKDLEEVNRVEVIDNAGRSYTCYNAKDVHYQLQDDGKTLKVFLNWNGSAEATKAKLEKILGPKL